MSGLRRPIQLHLKLVYASEGNFRNVTASNSLLSLLDRVSFFTFSFIVARHEVNFASFPLQNGHNCFLTSILITKVQHHCRPRMTEKASKHCVLLKVKVRILR
jgi:hypothetical protein